MAAVSSIQDRFLLAFAAEQYLSSKIQAKSARTVFSYAFSVDESFAHHPRPQKIVDKEESHYKEASRYVSTFISEGYTGVKSYRNQRRKEYSLGPTNLNGSLKTSSFIKNHVIFLSLPSGTPYKHLDVGCGNRVFGVCLQQAIQRLGYHIESHGLSASELRDNPVEDPCYHIGDAAKLLRHPILSLKKWHCITVVLCLIYLADNANMFAVCYELLEPGGILIVDCANLLGLKSQELVLFLNEHGYPVILINKNTETFEVDTIIIQKTHDHLNLPICYDSPALSDCGRAIYIPDPRYMDVDIEQREGWFKGIYERFSAAESTGHALIIHPGDAHPLTQLFQRSFEKFSV